MLVPPSTVRVAATELRHCNWGMQYSKGFSAAMPYLAQVRSLSRLILADARILAAQGDYRQALERCLAAYRLAGHVGDEVLISFLVSVAVSAQANKCVTDILGQMPADAGTLTWLKGQLAAVPTATLTANKSMALEREVALETLRPERIGGSGGNPGRTQRHECRGNPQSGQRAGARSGRETITRSTWAPPWPC